MGNAVKIDREALKFTVKFDPTDADLPWVILDGDGDEFDRFETRAEAKEEAAERTAEAIEAATEEAKAERAEQEEAEREELADQLKDLIEGLDIKALKALAKRLGA